MVRLNAIRIREQVYPDPDYEHLDIIKINRMTDADCRRVLDSLKQNDVSSSINRNKVTENKIRSNSKHLQFKQQNNESNHVTQPLKKPRLDQNKQEKDQIGCAPVNRMLPSKSEPKASDKFAKPVTQFKEISSFLIEPPPACYSKAAQDSRLAFQVIYGRYKPYKKNKEWTYDGFLAIKPEGITLYKCSGAIESRLERATEKVPKYFSTGTHLIIGQWECEICDQLLFSEFETGAYFAPDN
uniref:Uncharacterized protein LOC113792051 n=1 Tax=Dermatophagoides pteronyssinus TaxID=6956 RepID=A0A6P6XXS3_DERPT|nr:uncharacterized protein LOC113792051 [Dermatophagoides pteronyssinus]